VRHASTILVTPQPNDDALISAKKLLQDAGSLEAAAQAISIVHDLQEVISSPR